MAKKKGSSTGRVSGGRKFLPGEVFAGHRRAEPNPEFNYLLSRPVDRMMANFFSSGEKHRRSRGC